MNYYYLPGTGVFGGIKVGFHFCDMLASLQVPVIAVTPDGQAPHWFFCSTPVISRDQMISRLTREDAILFSLPHDYAELKQTPARLIFHCQGTDPLIEPVVSDADVTLLSCWKQAEQRLTAMSGRQPVDVGISISDCFFYDGLQKPDDRVSFMPRRGSQIALQCKSATPQLEYIAIHKQSENECAASLKKSGYFLATSVGEYFGLPALEAMAAGCVVVSVPVLGGMEYLSTEHNCIVAEEAHLPTTLKDLALTENHAKRARLRHAARVTAGRYSRAAQKQKLRPLLASQLKECLSWQ